MTAQQSREDVEVAQDAESRMWRDNKVLPPCGLGVQVQISHCGSLQKTLLCFLAP